MRPISNSQSTKNRGSDIIRPYKGLRKYWGDSPINHDLPAGSIGLTGRQAELVPRQAARRALLIRGLRFKGRTAENSRKPLRIRSGSSPRRKGGWRLFGYFFGGEKVSEGPGRGAPGLSKGKKKSPRGSAEKETSCHIRSILYPSAAQRT